MKKYFGTADGKDLFLYTLENANGMRADVCSLGATLIRLDAPDYDGKLQDVVLGFDTPEEYLKNGGCFGATIGPNANRIGNASYKLQGIEYRLTQNDGKNNIHSDRERGLHRRIWDVEEKENAILFSISLAHMELGFGGNKKICVCYEVTSDNGLKITYDIESDRDTIINMTNHSYFNLNGHNAGSIEGHRLCLEADYYTPIRADKIPTGELSPVGKGCMDFRELRKIGEKIQEPCEQLKISGGYDHNWVCRAYDGRVRKIAAAENEVGTRRMEVYSDLPGVQFYSGNFSTEITGKQGAIYGFRSGFALETQFYPDTPNHPNFPQSVFGPGHQYHTETEYRFITRKYEL